MDFLWNSIIFVLFAYCVRSDSIESKTSERDESLSSGFGYETNSHSQHPQQSSLMLNNNGYNNNENSFSQSFVQESSRAHTYSSGDQSNGQFDKNQQKTVILAIPVKLALQSAGQQNYETSPQHPVVEPTHAPHSSLSNNNYSPTYSTHSKPNLQPKAISANSHASEHNNQNVNYQISLLTQQHQGLAPLSQKVYSSLNSPQYSTAKSLNNPNSNENYNNGQQYKTASNLNEAKDYRSNEDKYGKNDNYRWNERDEYKADTNGGADDYGSNKYRNTHNSHIKYDDDNEEKSLYNSKENTKSLYDSDSKLEYDYDSNSDSDHKFDDYDNTKVKDSYNSKDYNQKTGHYITNNNRNNRYNGKSSEEKPDIIRNHNNNYFSLNGQSFVTNQDSNDGWDNDNYQILKPNSHNWPQIYDTFDSNGFSFNARGIGNKESGSNAYFTSASDLFGDTHLRAASTPVRSKIYGSSSSHRPLTSQASYEPLSLFAGYGRDYGRVNINGELIPAPLVASHPPRKLHKPPGYEGNKFLEFGDFINSDLVKLPQRNPFVMRPNFMSGLRPSKPLANYSPFASASTNSFLSSFPGIHTINKSFPRQLFPALYG